MAGNELIVDAHIHLTKEGATDPELSGGTLEDLFMYMELRDISRCLVLPTAEMGLSPSQTQFSLSTIEVLEISRKHPETIIPFANLNWRWGSRAIEKMREYAKMGCKGCGEVDHDLVVDDSRILPLYKVCGELGVPVLIHINPYPVNPDLDGFMRVLREFPDTTFIVHGTGWWKHISKEVSLEERYPLGKVEPGGKVDLILHSFPNAYADISAHSGLNALQRDFCFAHNFLERNKDKILYGTDFPCKNKLNNERFGVDGFHLNLLRSLSLTQETFEKVTRKNIEKLLKS